VPTWCECGVRCRMRAVSRSPLEGGQQSILFPSVIRSLPLPHPVLSRSPSPSPPSSPPPPLPPPLCFTSLFLIALTLSCPFLPGHSSPPPSPFPVVLPRRRARSPSMQRRAARARAHVCVYQGQKGTHQTKGKSPSLYIYICIYI
jgi:hypothetical protein